MSELKRPSEALDNGREIIRALTRTHRASNPRLYGSVLRGGDTVDSDLDILVDPLPGTTLFDFGGLQMALEDALGVRVDVKTPMDLPDAVRLAVLREAIPI